MIISESSLNDFLVFLKIDLFSREILVKRCFNNQNFDQLTDFLFTINSSLNQNLIFSKVLENYKYHVKNENFYFDLEQIEIKITELLELKRDSLETFNVFDMFDSSELVKSKSSEIVFFSFYENLLNDSNNSISEDFIQIFRLFEQFLNNSKEKSILLVEISFDKSSKFYQFVKSFYFAYQEKIESIVTKNSKFFIKFIQSKLSFQTFIIASLFAFIALLNLVGVRSSRPRFPNPNNPSGSFASMTSRLGQGIYRINRESDEGSSLTVAAPATGISSERSLVLKQPRPNPRNVILSASRSSKGGVTYNQSTLSTRSQKNATKIVLGKLSFANLSSDECIEVLTNYIRQKFPGSYVTIRFKFGIIDGVYQELNEITISGTTSQFGRLDRIKSEIIRGVKQTGI